MMKFSVLPFMAAAFAFTSCIKDELPNSECDIERFVVNTDSPESLFYKESDAMGSVVSSDSVIEISIRNDIEADALKALSLTFDITPGAVITPENGSVQDFSGDGVYYTVVSEDGQWNRRYLVRFVPQTAFNPHFSFEDVELEPSKQKYYNWFGYNFSGDRQDLWATGNSGFALSKSSALPMEYPTVPHESGVEGKAVKLITCSTGAFGSMVKMPIAAGNLFLGTFDTQNALKDPMKATKFGVPNNRKPLTFRGYYKFQPGESFQNRDGLVYPDSIDAPDAYSVLYKNTDSQGNPVVLHGDDVLTNENIVAIARMKDFVSSGVDDAVEWIPFSVDFEYTKPVDPVLLKNYGYNIAVVFTSSIYGAEFSGAIGSTLLVDETEVVFE